MKSALKGFLERSVGAQVKTALDVSRSFTDEKAKSQIATSVANIARDRGYGEADIFDILYRINRQLYPKFVINDRGRIMLNDVQFREFANTFISDNWTSFERKWNVREFLNLVRGVSGDLAECGVFTGGTSFLLCEFASKNGRQVHLFDSFEGLSEPDANDGSHWSRGNLTAPEELVHENLKGFSCFTTFKGWIPDAFPESPDQRYCFLHVDVDLEQPTYDSIAYFYPRMSRGAVIVLDDHGYEQCPGARKAVLSFMADKPEPVIDLSTGQGMIIKQ